MSHSTLYNSHWGNQRTRLQQRCYIVQHRVTGTGDSNCILIGPRKLAEWFLILFCYLIECLSYGISTDSLLNICLRNAQFIFLKEWVHFSELGSIFAKSDTVTPICHGGQRVCVHIRYGYTNEKMRKKINAWTKMYWPIWILRPTAHTHTHWCISTWKCYPTCS